VPTKPYILAISNRKGGVGKTTASVNIAAELEARGQRVLLLDLDTQGHCAVGLGVKVEAGDATLHELFLQRDMALMLTVKPTIIPKLYLSPANQAFEHSSGERDELRLARALAAPEIKAGFDVVIIDTPPSLDIWLINALAAANGVLVPYVPHHLSYEGVRQLMRILFKIMSGSNPGLKILGFLPMMVAQHIRQHRKVTAEVSRQFGANRIMPGIRNDIRLAEAFAAGKPIRDYAARCRGAHDFSALAENLVTMLANSAKQLP
jgi:chromosome partitioning protein